MAALPPIEDDQLWALFERGDEIGLRLERTEGGITWEGFPGLRHQELAVSICSTFTPSDDSYVQARDVYIRFPSGIVKRPDISIFCERPEEEEGFIYAIPEAVIEITSPKSEAKDLIDGPPLYLRNGVKDVLVLERTSNEVHHWTSAGVTQHPSPVKLTLSCGCIVTI